MLVAPFKVVLDANVLFPFTLRDTLLRAAAEGLFQIYWSAVILDEAVRNLVASTTITKEQGVRLRAAMEKAFPEAEVTGYDPLIAGMQNDPKDRHVVAAAVKAGAQVIVTFNLRDFDALPDGIEAQSPDEFLSNLFDLDPAGIVELLHDQAAALKKPVHTFAEVVSALAKMVPEFAAAVLKHAGEPA
jgi:predicted nucleic acid-binding protein